MSGINNDGGLRGLARTAWDATAGRVGEAGKVLIGKMKGKSVEKSTDQLDMKQMLPMGDQTHLGNKAHEKVDVLATDSESRLMSTATSETDNPSFVEPEMAKIPDAPKLSKGMLAAEKKPHRRRSGKGSHDIHLKTRKSGEDLQKTSAPLSPKHNPEAFDFVQNADGSWNVTPKTENEGLATSNLRHDNYERVLSDVRQHGVEREENLERIQHLQSQLAGSDLPSIEDTFLSDGRMSAVNRLEAQLDAKTKVQHKKMLLSEAQGRVDSCVLHKTKSQKLVAKLMKFVKTIQNTKMFRGRKLSDQFVEKLTIALTNFAQRHSEAATDKLEQAKQNYDHVNTKLYGANPDTSVGTVNSDISGSLMEAMNDVDEVVDMEETSFMTNDSVATATSADEPLLLMEDHFSSAEAQELTESASAMNADGLDLLASIMLEVNANVKEADAGVEQDSLTVTPEVPFRRDYRMDNGEVDLGSGDSVRYKKSDDSTL